jgi:small subunit ribosomal protein S16
MRLTPIQNCSNRRFYRLAVMRQNDSLKQEGIIEDLGSIDPMPNKDNQILVALNIERIKYYLGKQVPLKGSVGSVLGKLA